MKPSYLIDTSLSFLEPPRKNMMTHRMRQEEWPYINLIRSSKFIFEKEEEDSINLLPEGVQIANLKKWLSKALEIFLHKTEMLGTKLG